MKITAIETYWTRIPFDMGGKPATVGGLNWQTMNTVWLRIVTDQGLGGLGRSLRPCLRGNHDGRAEHSARARRAGPGRARHRRSARPPVESVPRLRPQRRARVRAVRARHRAMGHRRQGRRPAAMAAVRRDAGGAAHLLCQPAALRRGIDGRRRLRTRHGARLPRHQAARDHRPRGPRRAPGDRSRCTADGRHQLPLDRRGRRSTSRAACASST